MNLGSLLRRQRNNQGLTLRAVAERAGVSEGFMSQVENNVKSPSVTTLMNICEALETEAGDILNRLRNQEHLFLIRKNEWDEAEVPHTGFATRRFCAPEDRTVLDSAVIFLEPGALIPVRKEMKNGQEVLSVLQGQVELRNSGKTTQLYQGDAAHFWSEPGDQWISNPGKSRTVVMWVGTL